MSTGHVVHDIPCVMDESGDQSAQTVPDCMRDVVSILAFDNMIFFLISRGNFPQSEAASGGARILISALLSFIETRVVPGVIPGHHQVLEPLVLNCREVH